ncbi:hypothetical protein TIFTF001_001439 [Ficus carica]|uniref:Uncharacterized protein n=1 Tax=Ficus carica TaxID=3494 RepID=A0AA87ZI49_FICCA|nr:hypothetical protein TIFTF001_001439 [Ficus carica]
MVATRSHNHRLCAPLGAPGEGREGQWTHWLSRTRQLSSSSPISVNRQIQWRGRHQRVAVASMAVNCTEEDGEGEEVGVRSRWVSSVQRVAAWKTPEQWRCHEISL